MEAFRKALVVGAMLGVGAGVGSALFVLVTPGEERIQAMLKVGAVWSLSWDGRPGGELRAWNPTRTTNLSSPPAGDAGAGPAGQGRDGQEQAVSAGHSAGGSGHAGECGLEEELDGRRRRQVSVSRNLPQWALGPLLRRWSPRQPFSSMGLRGVPAR